MATKDLHKKFKKKKQREKKIQESRKNQKDLKYNFTQDVMKSGKMRLFVIMGIILGASLFVYYNYQL